jgi:hypothetical protein
MIRFTHVAAALSLLVLPATAAFASDGEGTLQPIQVAQVQVAPGQVQASYAAGEGAELKPAATQLTLDGSRAASGRVAGGYSQFGQGQG